MNHHHRFKAHAVTRFGKEKLVYFKKQTTAEEFVQGIEKKGGRGTVHEGDRQVYPKEAA